MFLLLYHIFPGAHMCALYEVAEQVLVDEVRLCIFVDGLCCWRIVLAHVAKHVRGLQKSNSSIKFLSYCHLPEASLG